MKVRIIDDKETTVWEYGYTNGNRGGMTCAAYANNGTLPAIIDALELALEQALAELSMFQHVDGVLDVGAAPAQIQNNVPIT
jgi:hypothetical protein